MPFILFNLASFTPTIIVAKLETQTPGDVPAM